MVKIGAWYKTVRYRTVLLQNGSALQNGQAIKKSYVTDNGSSQKHHRTALTKGAKLQNGGANRCVVQNDTLQNCTVTKRFSITKRYVTENATFDA